MEIWMGILMMDSMGWPYDSSDCLLLIFIDEMHLYMSTTPTAFKTI